MFWVIQNSAGGVVFRSRHDPHHSAAIKLADDRDPRTTAPIVASVWIVKDERGNILDICPRFPNHPAAELVEDPATNVDYRRALLVQRKAATRAAIAGAHEGELARGMRYRGKVLQLREQDLANIRERRNDARWAIAGGSRWPADFAWRMADNTFLELAAADAMLELAAAADAERERLRQNKWRLDALVDSATTIEGLDAIDVGSGWRGGNARD